MRQRSARRVVLGESSATGKPSTAGQLVLNPVGVEKVCRQNIFSDCERTLPSASSLSSLGGNFQNGSCRLAEEPHQALEVLRSRGQEELFPHELESPQAQTTQADLILQFGE